MRRAVAILKYVPTVLCGLLVVAWVVSLFGIFSGAVRVENHILGITLGPAAGSLTAYHNIVGPNSPYQFVYVNVVVTSRPRLSERLGEARFWRPSEFEECSLSRPDKYGFTCSLPILAILTLAIPLVAAPFAPFPLWSYFAWTALIAAELAYYLR